MATGGKLITELNENWYSNIIVDENNMFQSVSPNRANYVKPHREDLFYVCHVEKGRALSLFIQLLPKDGISVVTITSCLANPLPVELLPTIPVYRNLFATKKPYTSTKLQIILITL
ncbi:unnamed protein product [Musa banksii]